MWFRGVRLVYLALKSTPNMKEIVASNKKVMDREKSIMYVKEYLSTNKERSLEKEKEITQKWAREICQWRKISLEGSKSKGKEKKIEEERQRLFLLKIQIKNKKVLTLINPNFQKNLISKSLVPTWLGDSCPSSGISIGLVDQRDQYRCNKEIYFQSCYYFQVYQWNRMWRCTISHKSCPKDFDDASMKTSYIELGNKQKYGACPSKQLSLDKDKPFWKQNYNHIFFKGKNKHVHAPQACGNPKHHREHCSIDGKRNQLAMTKRNLPMKNKNQPWRSKRKGKEKRIKEERQRCSVLKVQIINTKASTLVDPSFEKKMISESLVQWFGLHPQAYALDWLIKDTNKQVTKKCKVIFSITSRYIDENECDVVPLVIVLIQRNLMMLPWKQAI